MNKLKRYIIGLLIFISCYSLNAAWRDWFSWTSWKNWWTNNTGTGQLFFTQPEITPANTKAIAQATAIEAFKQAQADKMLADKKLEQVQGPTQQPIEKQVEPRKESTSPVTEPLILPSDSSIRRKQEQIDNFMGQVNKFFSDISQFHYAKLVDKPNFAKNFKKLTDDNRDFIDKLQGIKKADVPDAFIKEFQNLMPIPWLYLLDLNALIYNKKIELIDEKVKEMVQGELIKNDPDFIKRLQQYGAQDKTLEQIPLEDQLRLLNSYRKYQIETIWKNLKDNKGQLIKNLKKINPHVDISWIFYYYH